MISGPGLSQRGVDDLIPSGKGKVAAALLTMFGFGVPLFALDLATPLGVADGIAYTPLLTATLFLPGRRSTIFAALVFSVLIVVGQLLGVGGVGQVAIVNRVLALTTLWIVSAVIIERKAAQDYMDGAGADGLSWLERLFGYQPGRAVDSGVGPVDPTVRDMANLYVQTYGDEAFFRAQERAGEFLKAGDHECYLIWVRITDAIETLQES